MNPSRAGGPMHVSETSRVSTSASRRMAAALRGSARPGTLSPYRDGRLLEDAATEAYRTTCPDPQD